MAVDWCHYGKTVSCWTARSREHLLARVPRDAARSRRPDGGDPHRAVSRTPTHERPGAPTPGRFVVKSVVKRQDQPAGDGGDTCVIGVIAREIGAGPGRLERP